MGLFHAVIKAVPLRPGAYGRAAGFLPRLVHGRLIAGAGRAIMVIFLCAFMLSACTTDPGRAVFDKAETTFSNGDIETALSQYQYVVDKHPESSFAPKSQYRIAQIYNRYIGDKKRAMEAYSTLYFMYPNAPETIDAREDLAAIYAANGDHVLAIEQYQRFITDRPSEYTRIQYMIAMEYIMLNDFRQARVEFTELLNRASGERLPEIQYQIANTYYIEGSLDDALAGYGKVIECYPQTSFAVDAKLGIAKSLSESGRLDEALALLKGLKDKYPNRAAIDVLMEAVQLRIDEGVGSEKYTKIKEKSPSYD
ncbi:MAG: tetratricopeptide repeat protein [Deltaproteobacteria bacterium]|nr:tetratricopeptide repeat protein [Deltaproteobacteria bacterium]